MRLQEMIKTIDMRLQTPLFATSREATRKRPITERGPLHYRYSFHQVISNERDVDGVSTTCLDVQPFSHELSAETAKGQLYEQNKILRCSSDHVTHPHHDKSNTVTTTPECQTRLQKRALCG